MSLPTDNPHAPLSQEGGKMQPANHNGNMAVAVPFASATHPGQTSPANAMERLREHPRANIDATMDPTPKAPVEFILVHKAPAQLLPVLNDKRTRNEPEYQAYFTNFTADVKAHGVLQPVIAVAEGDAARVVDGETRRQAALLAGLETIPILVYQRELSEAELVIAQLQANAQRRDFTPLELAAVYQELMRLNDWTQSELANQIHVSQAHVAKVLAISTKLCVEVQALVGSGQLCPRTGYALSRLPNHARQIEIARKAAELPMAAETVEGIVDGELKGNRKVVSKPSKFCACGVTGNVKGNVLEAFKALHAKLGEILKRVERDPALADVILSLLKSPSDRPPSPD